MGYFDDAKASREDENTLEHSSGAWKKHKYIQKIGEGANAVYKYAKKKVDTDITGNAYKNNAQKYLDDGGTTKGKVYNEEMIKYYDKSLAGNTEKIKNRIAESAYYTKSLAGKASKTVARGKALIKDFFTPKTKVTASSNLTGKETINTKPAEKVTLKKNKLSFKKK